jgi:hypothetical protein
MIGIVIRQFGIFGNATRFDINAGLNERTIDVFRAI